MKVSIPIILLIFSLSNQVKSVKKDVREIPDLNYPPPNDKRFGIMYSRKRKSSQTPSQDQIKEPSQTSERYNFRKKQRVVNYSDALTEQLPTDSVKIKPKTAEEERIHKNEVFRKWYKKQKELKESGTEEEKAKIKARVERINRKFRERYGKVTEKISKNIATPKEIESRKLRMKRSNESRKRNKVRFNENKRYRYQNNIGGLKTKLIEYNKQRDEKKKALDAANTLFNLSFANN